MAWNKHHLLVVLQQFDGKETGRILVSDGLVLGNVLLDVRDALLQHRAVVYVNVAEEPVLVGMLQFLLHILVSTWYCSSF